MSRQPDGSVLKTFLREELLVPANTVITKNPRPELRYVEMRALPPEEEFPKGCAVVFTGSKQGHYGAVGKVVKIDEKTAEISVEIRRNEACKKDWASALNLVESKVEPRYFNVRQIATSLKCSSYVVSMVTSSLLIKPGFIENRTSAQEQKTQQNGARLHPNQ